MKDRRRAEENEKLWREVRIVVIIFGEEYKL
jgi:hypothetical protein